MLSEADKEKQTRLKVCGASQPRVTFFTHAHSFPAIISHPFLLASLQAASEAAANPTEDDLEIRTYGGKATVEAPAQQMTFEEREMPTLKVRHRSVASLHPWQRLRRCPVTPFLFLPTSVQPVM